MEWRKMQEGLGAETGRQRRRIGMGGAKWYRRPGPPRAEVPKKKKVRNVMNLKKEMTDRK
jgi:hypothetical protein